MIFQPSGGLVGIGTIAPISNGGAAAGLLHINGQNTWAATHYTNTSTGAGTGDGGVIAQIGTNLEIFNYEAGEIRLSSNNTRAITIDSSQNVGIGTTSPSAQLHSNVTGGSINYGMFTIDTNAWLNFFTGTGTAPGAGSAGQGALYWKSGGVFRLGTSTSTAGAGFVDMVRIDQNGNVGIGTTSPGVKLDVDGQIRSNDSFLLQSGTTAIGSIRNQAGALDIRGDSTRDVSIGSVTTPQALFVEGSNGNVGIGTTTPGVKLHVDSGNTETIAYFKSTDNRGRISVADNDTTTYVISEDTKMSLGTNASLSTGNLTIDSTGNVGIGTTSPSRKLHVHADSGNAYLQLTQATTGTTSNDGFQISMGASQVNFINRENGSMVFETNNTEKMRITSAGNVGIGTTNPTEILHLSSDDTNLWTRIDNTNWVGGEFSGLWFRHGTQDYFSTQIKSYVEGGSSEVSLKFLTSINSATNQAMTIRGDGDVGIGTDSPNEKLEVSAASTPIIRITNTDTTLVSNEKIGGLEVYGNDSTTPGAGVKAAIIAETQKGTGNDGNLTFYTSDGVTNNVEKMVLTSDGNLGIGLGWTDVQAKLHVAGGTETETLTYEYPPAVSSEAFNGEIVSFSTFLETTVTGNVLCFNQLGIGTTTGWRKTDNGNSVDSTGMLGIAMTIDGANQEKVLLRGFAKSTLYNTTNLGTNPQGKKLYLTNTEGELTTSIPTSNYVRTVGYVVEADGTDGTIYFCPDNTYIFI